MIYTITLNPALDRHLFLREIEFDSVMNSDKVEVFAGGKGINVSRAVMRLGGKTMASGLIGGHTGERVLRLLHDEGIACDFIRTEKETRICTFIHETTTGREIKVNTPGPVMSEAEVQILMERIDTWETSTVAISGSAPQGIKAEIYFHLVENLNKKGMKTILDASGDNLIQGLHAKPYMVCPNSTELGTIRGIDPMDIEKITDTALKMAGDEAEIVVVTLGEGGLIVAHKGKALRFIPPFVKVVDSTGAGDAVTGAFAWCMEKGYEIWDAARFATACGTASVLQSGGGACSMKNLKKMLKEITVIRLV